MGAGFDADYFVFVDGDAEVLPGSIAALVQELEDNPGCQCRCRPAAQRA